MAAAYLQADVAQAMVPHLKGLGFRVSPIFFEGVVSGDQCQTPMNLVEIFQALGASCLHSSLFSVGFLCAPGASSFCLNVAMM